MKREFLKSFYIAGFTYYDGAYVFPQLSPEEQVRVGIFIINKK